MQDTQFSTKAVVQLEQEVLEIATATHSVILPSGFYSYGM